MRKLGVIFFLSLLVLGCSEESRKDLLPRNSGNLGEVVVVAPAEVWATDLGTHLSKAMSAVLYGLPQDELLLTRVKLKESGFNDMYRTHRNVLKIEVHPKQKSSVRVRKNVYSRQQVYILITLQELDDLRAIVDRHMPQILKQFFDAEIDRLIDRNRTFGKKELNQEIKEATGLDLIMQDKFQVAVKKDDFLWLRLDQSKPLGGYQHTISQGFMIYWRPYRDTLDFSDSSLLQWKNEINQRYVKGPQNSKMTISDRFILPRSEWILFEGESAKQIRGLWRMEGYFMGGPFYALSFFDPNSGRQYMVEGYAYAPQFNKAPYIREIEAIAKSVSLPGIQGEESTN